MAQQSALGVGGTPAQIHGSFSGKETAPGGEHPVGRITRLGVSGFGRPQHGSFAGKEVAAGGEHPVVRITRLGVSATTRPQYGSFAGKVAADVAVEENFGGSTWLASQAKRDKLLRDDEDILNVIVTMVTSGILDG